MVHAEGGGGVYVHSSARSRIAGAALVAALAACGGNAPSTSSLGRPGEQGASYLVQVQRPENGTVTSGADGKIDCGSAPTATRCGPASYAWEEQAILLATADAGYMLGTWAGDCTGRPTNASGQYVCVLDTARYGADKFVAAVFGPQGRTLHTNFTLPAVHGAAFKSWIKKEPDAFECTYCHGRSYAGIGIALSCNQCHADAGIPSWQTTCDFCHEAPPLMRSAGGTHPDTSTVLTTCAGCHAGTVDGTGTLVPGGLHMNGQMDGGHQDGFAAPAVHGREFFGSILETGSGCAACHGDTYASTIANGQSCNTCHEAAGWTSWQTNCSFCHGLKDAATQAGYALADHPTWSSPPDAISQRLTGEAAPDPTGAHTIHLTGSSFARAFECSVCHAVPTTVSHISGRTVRGAVALTAPGQAAPDPDGYSTVTQTCATACHGASGSPAWTFKGLACDGCHAVPPATPAHGGLSGSDLTLCAGCHETTIAPDGTFILPNGTHINGTVDRPAGHEPVGADPYTVPSVHGSQYLSFVANVAGASACTSCHSTALSLCNSCHSRAASGSWVSWETNCTFCHGTRTPVYTPANLALSAPPDAVVTRLAGVTTPTIVSTKNGKHSVHLSGGSHQATPCAACHPVPTTTAHVSVDRAATVTLSAELAFPGLTTGEYAVLNATVNGTSFGTYNRTTNRCSVYCHGTAAWNPINPVSGLRYNPSWVPTPRWSSGSAALSCNSCHGQPPATGKRVPIDSEYCVPDDPEQLDCSIHEWHLNLVSARGWDKCGACHSNNIHLNGRTDMGWLPGTSATWNPATKSCTSSCHTSPTTPHYWAP